MPSLADNLETVRASIARSAQRSGRNPDEVTLVAVTKGFPISRIREAIGLGLRVFGENRVQEAIPKIDELGITEATWHLIGHLQSNIAGALTSSGNLRLQGLMTIAPMVSDLEQVRPVFRRLRTLRDETSQRLGMPLPVLSMGMTDDFTVAVEEGATMLRLGRALFG